LYFASLTKLTQTSLFNDHSGLVGASPLLAPIPVMAVDEGGLAAFSLPLVVSVLTVPVFIYYTNALKPRDIKVKQIEVDEFNREKKKKGKR